MCGMKIQTVRPAKSGVLEDNSRCNLGWLRISDQKLACSYRIGLISACAAFRIISCCATMINRRLGKYMSGMHC